MFTVQLTSEFQDWLDALADKRAQLRIVARIRQAEGENLGDWGSIQGGLSEMRIHFGPGYRLYFSRRGSVLVVLLNGGTKSTQARDIKRAKRLLQELDLDS